VKGFGIARGHIAWRDGDAVALFEQGESLDALMARGPAGWAEARGRGEEAISRGDGIALAEAENLLPFAVADYVDFYSSLEHATNMGRLLRPGGEPLLPNWRWLPIGYHGRAGTVVVSGTEIRRPRGQRGAGDFGPTQRLDIELELGFVIGTPSRLGEPVPPGDALQHVFGAVLVNDWSARDLQAWEYQPLGPFLGKSFATSISAWVTPIDLLPRVPLPAQEPEPHEYLRTQPLGFDVPLEVELNGEVVSRTNARHLYWSIEQQIAHLTSNGASLRTGDLLATGTISGPDPGTEGSLFEKWRGDRFLADGDEVVLRGEGLADVSGAVVPAAA
jgi:fumarylacetoacetase